MHAIEMRAGEWFFTNRPLCGRPTLPNRLLGFKRTAVSAALQVWSFEIRLNVRWGDFEREGTKSPRAGFPGPGQYRYSYARGLADRRRRRAWNLRALHTRRYGSN